MRPRTPSTWPGRPQTIVCAALRLPWHAGADHRACSIPRRSSRPVAFLPSPNLSRARSVALGVGRACAGEEIRLACRYVTPLPRCRTCREAAPYRSRERSGEGLGHLSPCVQALLSRDAEPAEKLHRTVRGRGRVRGLAICLHASRLSSPAMPSLPRSCTVPFAGEVG